MSKRITEQQVNPALQDSDVILTAKSAEDYQLTVETLSNHILAKINSLDTFNQVLDHDTNTSGLNANFLQGQDAAFFRNAANINDGVVPDTHLPQGDFNFSWAGSGTYPTAGVLKGVLKYPEIFSGGPRIMMQMGWTHFITSNQSTSITFAEPFASGWGGENAPLVTITPECRNENYPSQPSSPADRVEVDIRLYDKSLSGFSVAGTRTSGSGSDRARANWVAWGYY